MQRCLSPCRGAIHHSGRRNLQSTSSRNSLSGQELSKIRLSRKLLFSIQRSSSEIIGHRLSRAKRCVSGLNSKRNFEENGAKPEQAIRYFEACKLLALSTDFNNPEYKPLTIDDIVDAYHKAAKSTIPDEGGTTNKIPVALSNLINARELLIEAHNDPSRNHLIFNNPSTQYAFVQPQSPHNADSGNESSSSTHKNESRRSATDNTYTPLIIPAQSFAEKYWSTGLLLGILLGLIYYVGPPQHYENNIQRNIQRGMARHRDRRRRWLKDEGLLPSGTSLHGHLSAPWDDSWNSHGCDRADDHDHADNENESTETEHSKDSEDGISVAKSTPAETAK